MDDTTPGLLIADAATVNAPDTAVMRESMTTMKIQSLLAYLDDVDQAVNVAPPPPTAATTPTPPPTTTPSSSSSPWPYRRQEDDVSTPDHYAAATTTTGDDNDALSHPHSHSHSTSAPPDPSKLASNVLGGLKSKLAAHESLLQEREARILTLESCLSDLQEETRAVLASAQATHESEVQRLKDDQAAALARHLAFIDQLMRDKEALTDRVSHLAGQTDEARVRADRQVALMRDRLAQELARRQATWQQGESSRREAWLKEKEAEIKDRTVRAMEPEVTRIVAKHRGEMRKLEETLREEHRLLREEQEREFTRRLVSAQEAARTEQTESVHRVRETLLAEAKAQRDALVEAHDAAMDACRRRLTEEREAKVAHVETLRRQDQAEHARALAQLEAAARQHQTVIQGLQQDEAAAKRELNKALRTLKDKDVEEEAWRAAVTERAKRELAEREKKVVQRLEAEKEREMDLLGEKLEEDYENQLEMERRKATHALEVLKAQGAAELDRVKQLLVVATQRNEELEKAQGVASERVKNLVAMEAEREGWKGQVGTLTEACRGAQEEVARLTRELERTKVDADKTELAREKQNQRELAELRERLMTALQDKETIKTKHAVEIANLEERVKSTLDKKDERMRQLRKEMDMVSSQLAEFQAALAV